MKRCCKCHQEKPMSEFYDHPKRLDGKQSECKQCQLDRQRAREAAIRNGTWIPRQRKNQTYRRGTLDMPKCSVPNCRNHLYWECEKREGICIHHHNLKRRHNAPRNLPTVKQASFA